MNLPSIFRRAAAALCAGALLLSAAGCGSGSGSPADEPDGGFANTGSTAMGRWVEQPVSLPEGGQPALYSTPCRAADGSLFLYAAVGEALCRFTSQDNGESWQCTPTDWAQQMQGMPYHMALCQNGVCYLLVVDSAADFHLWLYEPEQDALTELALPQGFSRISGVYFIDADRVLLSGYYTVPEGSASGHDLMTENGQSYQMFSAIYDLHLQNEPIPFQEEEGYYSGQLSGAAMDASDPAQPRLYRLAYYESGVRLQAIGADGAITSLFDGVPSATDAAFGATTDAQGNYYYASGDGIYRIAKGGSLAELLFGASTFQLGLLQNQTCMGLCRAENGDFFVLLTNDDRTSALYRYHWDETLPASTGDSLSVWSLQTNQTVRAALVELAAQHPEIEVEYTAALEQDSVSQSDAISALNAQLLAGSGPDVLILDGLDYRTYQQQGLLADLAPALEQSALLPNVTAPFVAQDGSITVLPARFSVPLLYSDDAGVAQLDSLEALQQALLACAPRPAMDLNDDAYYQERSGSERYGMSVLSVADLLDFTLQASASALWDGSSLNADALRQVLGFVQAVGLHNGLKDYSPDLQENWTSMGRDGVDTITLADGGYEFSFTRCAHYGRGLMQTSAFLGETGYVRGESATVRLQPGLDEGAYLPSTLTAVNAASQKQEQAMAFVSALFGQAVQAVYQGDGFAVRTDALETGLARNESYVAESGYTGEVRGLFAALQTPELPQSLPDPLYSALLAAGQALVCEEETLDEAVTEVQDALALYLSERQ